MKMSAFPHSVMFTFSQETYVSEEEEIFSGTSDPGSDFENCDVEEIDLLLSVQDCDEDYVRNEEPRQRRKLTLCCQSC